jgi:hypothetical protein
VIGALTIWYLLREDVKQEFQHQPADLLPSPPTPEAPLSPEN